MASQQNTTNSLFMRVTQRDYFKIHKNAFLMTLRTNYKHDTINKEIIGIIGAIYIL